MVFNKMKNKEKKIFFGGTFSANSITTYVGMKTTDYILKNKRKIFSNLKKIQNFSRSNESVF